MLNAWGPIGKKLLASINGSQSPGPSTLPAELRSSGSTSSLSDPGAESGPDTPMLITNIPNKPILFDENHGQAPSEGSSKDSNSDFSEPDDYEGTVPQAAAPPSRGMTNNQPNGTKIHDHISISDTNDDSETSDDGAENFSAKDKGIDDHMEQEMIKLLGSGVGNPNPSSQKITNPKAPTESAVPLSSMIYLGPTVTIENTDLPNKLSMIEDCEAI